MRRARTIITLMSEERQSLEVLARSRTAPHRAVQRAHLVLLAAEGMANTTIAREVGLSRARVVQWRQRFAQARLAGLNDAPRMGVVPKYDRTTERRILGQLDQPPPAGHGTRTGSRVAPAPGGGSADPGWRGVGPPRRPPPRPP